jgi:1-acyl-sn-glycerol-3-phosphate acyltransferase
MLPTVLKLTGMAALILGYLVMAAPALLLPSRAISLRWSAALTTAGSRLALRILGIDVRTTGPSQLPDGRAVLYVANHLSYLDILLLAAQGPRLFITSREVRQQPLLGWLARLGGSLFVERRTRATVLHDIAHISAVLQLGLPVVLFPEGTSSDGTGVLPFKSALMDAALRTGINVVPVCIKYQTVNRAPLGPTNRDYVCYYGDHTFATHFRRLCAVRSVQVCVQFLESIQCPAGADRKQMARRAYTVIQAAYA